MIDKEKVIKGLEVHLELLRNEKTCLGCPYINDDNPCVIQLIENALALLKGQEGKVTVPFSWLVKFCSHIDFKEPMCDSEREQAWKEKLKQQFGVNV